MMIMGIDANIEAIVVSKGCGELPTSLSTPQWPKFRFQFLFCYDETKSMLDKQIVSPR